MIKTEFPWQTLPANLIAYGIKHSEMESEFEQQVGFLLLDIGVETTLKVFHTLPENVSRVRDVEKKLLKQDDKFLLKITDVVNLDKTNFHFLISVARELTEEGLIEENDWKNLEYFHSIRNKLYHQGDGVTTTKANLNGYATLSRKLIRVLLSVDLEPDAWAAETRSTRNDGFFNGFWLVSFEEMGKDLSDALEGLTTELSVITEQEIPLYTTRRFIRDINHIWEEMMKDEGGCAEIEDMVAMRQDRRHALSALMGQDSTDNEEIDAIIENPSYLWFAVGLRNLYKNYNREFNRYLDARAFVHDIAKGRIWVIKEEDGNKVKSTTNNPDEIYREYEALQTWIKQVDKKARYFIAKLDKKRSIDAPSG
jgi:hypothetical protein